MRDDERILNYLSQNISDPVQEYLYITEILELPGADAYQRLIKTKHYQELADEQLPDGTWGRFHSMDSRLVNRRKFLSTEAALRRARDLGLKKDDPMINRCLCEMERYLTGESVWRDYTEKHHDGGRSFLTAFPFIIAANLCLFDPENPHVASKREVCLRTLELSFRAGSFDEDAWERENRAYTGPCLRAWMVYPLWLLGSADNMEKELERKYLDYIWHRREGIYYISNSAPSVKHTPEDREFTVWLSALEALSGFSLFPEFARDEVLPHLTSETLRIIESGVKLPPPHPLMGHYAENWRKGGARTTDLALRAARIIKKAGGFSREVVYGEA